MCSLVHNCHIFSCIVYIPGFSNQIVMSLWLVPSPLVVSAALRNSWPKETLSDVFVVLHVLFTWLSSQIFLIDSLIAARVVFQNDANFFNPKLFDTLYLQTKSQSHILAVKVLHNANLSFFAYILPTIALNVYYLATCVLCLCFLAVAVFFSLQLILSKTC